MCVPFPFFHNHSTEWQTFFQMRKSTYNTCTNLSNDLWNCSFNRILIINVIAALFCKYTPQLSSNTTVHIVHTDVLLLFLPYTMGKNQKKCNLRKSPSQWIKWKFLPFQKEKNVSFLHNVVILKRLIFTYLMQYFSNFFGPLWNIYREHMGLHSSQWIQFWNELFDMLKNFCYCGRIVTHQRILWLIKSFYYCSMLIMFVEVKISSPRAKDIWLKIQISIFQKHSQTFWTLALNNVWLIKYLWTWIWTKNVMSSSTPVTVFDWFLIW